MLRYATFLCGVLMPLAMLGASACEFEDGIIGELLYIRCDDMSVGSVGVGEYRRDGGVCTACPGRGQRHSVLRYSGSSCAYNSWVI